MDHEAGKAAKGKYGEDIVLTELKSIFGDDALFFRNVLIPQKSNSGKSFECDIICVSRKGIFVFEVKNWEGHIEANMLSQKWGFKKRYESNYSQFDNPVMQNEMHRTALSGLLGEPVASIVVLNNINNYFTINRYATDSVNVPVLLTTELKDFFSKNYIEDKYTNQQLYALYSKISDMEKESERLKAAKSIPATPYNGYYRSDDVVPAYDADNYSPTNRKKSRKQTYKRRGVRIRVDLRKIFALIVVLIIGLVLCWPKNTGRKNRNSTVSNTGSNNTTVASDGASTTAAAYSTTTTAADSKSELKSDIPDAVKNRRRYSIDELSAMPVVQTADYQISDMRLGESLLYRFFSESYVENYEQKTETAQAYITPVEYITGDDAHAYYDYLSKEFDYNRPLRVADNEEYAVVRLYWWYRNERINSIEFINTTYEESFARKNNIINFRVNESDYYWSNETGNSESITGLYIEDLDDYAIKNSAVASGTPVEIIYLIPISRDLDYTVILNPKYSIFRTRNARLILE